MAVAARLFFRSLRKIFIVCALIFPWRQTRIPVLRTC
jgi:hypothetical protein